MTNNTACRPLTRHQARKVSLESIRYMIAAMGLHEVNGILGWDVLIHTVVEVSHTAS